MKFNKILIVGGRGYLGRHLCSSLESAGYDIYITGTGELSKKNYYTLDFEDKTSYVNLRGLKFDLVMILAAKLGALNTIDLSHPDLKVNTICYADFLNFIAENKIADKVIFTSSMTVYRETNSIPVVESSELQPVNTYGLSKLLAENITSFFCVRNNIPGLVLRLPGIYGGDRNSGFIYNTLKKCKSDEAIILNTKGLTYWETINIDDVCCMITQLLDKYSWDKQFDVLNMGTGEETDFYKVAYFIRDVSLSKSKIIEETVKGYKPFYLSNTKLKSILNIETTFNHSLRKYICSL